MDIREISRIAGVVKSSQRQAPSKAAERIDPARFRGDQSAGVKAHTDEFRRKPANERIGS
ncbi:hypothetical protein M8R20_06070 [Pseudomonas sp. R2.Fl]|nr:hypothetical protein [Pseudomonas sp. R2.Fl]